VQEFISGREVTTDVICDLSGNALSIVLRERLEVRAGEVSKGVTIYDPRIVQDCLKICQSLDVIGPACVQCIVRDNVPFYTEVNTRFGGGFPLAVAAGADSPRLLVASLAKIPVSAPAIDSYQRGLCMARFDDSMFLSEDQRARIPRSSV
jgi:carbamoyl-phosphate synthase large subunit